MSNKQKFEKNMRRLLRQIAKGEELNDINDYDLECISECVDRGYLVGINIDRNARGYIIADFKRLTVKYHGYEFLDNRFPNLRSNIALVLSAIALLVSVLVAFTPFPELTKQFIGMLFSKAP